MDLIQQHHLILYLRDNGCITQSYNLTYHIKRNIPFPQIAALFDRCQLLRIKSRKNDIDLIKIKLIINVLNKIGAPHTKQLGLLLSI
jgi:hypothetical protein